MTGGGLEVKFYERVDDGLLRFAVIVAKHGDQWVFCRHRDRSTYEVPGGHREKGEAIADTARRELYEETGAKEFTLRPICAYSVSAKDPPGEGGDATYGMLYFAAIGRFTNLPPSEIACVALFDGLPERLTYPHIQPKLIDKVQSALAAL